MFGLSLSELAQVAQVAILIVSVVVVLRQISLLRKDLRLRARYEFFQSLFALNRFLIEHPEIGKPFETTSSWGSNEQERLFLYILNLFELVNDMRIEGIIAEADWNPWRNFIKDSLKSKDFRVFWQNVRTSEIYSSDIQRILDDAITEVLKEESTKSQKRSSA